MNYKEVIESRYNRQKWQLLLHDIFGSRADLWASPYEINTNSNMAKQAFWLGTITLADDETIAVYEVELSDKVDIERNRRGIRDMLLTEWRNRDAGAFMFCYRKNESVLRFSYVSEAWNFADDGSYTKESTDTKRFTYLLGEGHRSRTAIQQFEKLKASQLKLKDLTKAFSVEAVSDMFFNEYKKNYEDIIQYITGKRMVKVANKWEEKVMNDPCEEIMQEFAHFPNPEKSVRDYVKKLMGRLVFLQFLQKKGWLGVPANEPWGNGNPEFIQGLFADCADKDHFVDNVLEELFNDLNTERTDDLVSSAVGHNIRVPYLNGGLFEREATDETEFPLPAKYMQQMLDFFASYNFTIDENDPDDAEVGVDPEMLGRIFENLLEDNKDKGAFYTPKEIVTYMCRESLIAYLQTDIEDEATKEAIRQFVTTHEKNDKLPADTDQKLKDVKICDPAIGSGAFPMGLLKELFQCRTALEGIEQSKAAEIKKHIIQNNIYGVDIERGAVDIARLRFWLSLIVDEENPQALPNLDYKIVEGNSLITTFDGQYIDLEKGKGEARFRSSLINIQKEKKLLQEEQKRFFTLTGDEKYRSEIAIKKHILNTIWYQLDFEKHSWQDATIEQAGLFGATESKGRKKNTAQIAEFTPERQEVLNKCEEIQEILNDESKSLQERAGSIIPFFEWGTVFSEIFDGEINKGFDIVIGNPPYVQLQLNGGQLALLYEKCNYTSYTKTGDIYCLFYELGDKLLKRDGFLCYITSNKWMRAGYGEKLRSFLCEKTNPIILIDFGGYKVFDSATVDTNILLYKKTNNSGTTISYIATTLNKEGLANLSEIVRKEGHISSFYTSDSWIILSPAELKMKQKIEFGRKRLGDIITLSRGVGTGLDDAYFLTEQEKSFLLSQCQSTGELERTKKIIHPLLRGRDIKRYSYEWANLWMIYIPLHFPLEDDPKVKGVSKEAELLFQNNYPTIYSHLSKYKEKLSARDKKETGIRYEWYCLQRPRYEKFKKLGFPKIIYQELSQGSPFAVDVDGRFLLSNSAYFIISDNILFLTGLLNSSLIEFAFEKFYSTKLGTSGIRWLAQNIVDIPIPHATDEQIKYISNLVEKILKAKSIGDSDEVISSESEIDSLVYKLYGLNEDEIKMIEETKKEG